MNELPIACSLGAGDFAARLEAIRSVGESSLLGQRLAGRTAVLRFASRGDAARRLEQIVAAEAECCPFLELTLERRRDTIVLTIEAPEGAQNVLEELVGAFGPVAA